MTTFPTQIGPYEVESEIGRGGMGVVYLATDSRLDRKVAIKALPEFFKDDPQRLARFEREAKTLASLNHPNIAGIHGVEEVDGARYLVMEFVDGETLAEALDRGPLSVEDAVDICSQVAAGLEAAHEAGVIHRDLKPANIKITPDGDAKVLDFGLARTEETSASGSSVSQLPTLTTPHTPTTPGAILGTAPYMSPEQARGRRVDKRSDIWSFGVVLYECLTGASPFVGETITDSIGAILHKDPDLNQIPADAHPLIHHVLRRCLSRDKARRYRDIGDVRVDLQDIASGAPHIGAAESTTRSRLPAALVGVVGLLVGSLAIVVVNLALTSQQRPVVRKFRTMDFDGQLEPRDNFAISPDGTAIAFATEGGQLWVRRFDQLQAQRLVDGGTSPIVNPAWSPDSEWIAYFSGSNIYKIPAIGGAPIQIGAVNSNFIPISGAGWSEDGYIYYSELFGQESVGLRRISANGGSKVAVFDPDQNVRDLHDVATLPEGRGAIYVPHTVDQRRKTIGAWSSDGGARIIYESEADISQPVYSRTGHILFEQSGGVWALPFDLNSLSATGEPFIVSPDATAPSVSDDGTLVHLHGGGASGAQELIWADSNGQRIGSAFGRTQLDISRPALSADGARVATISTDKTGDTPQVWVHDTERRIASLYTFDESPKESVQWIGDTSEILYEVFREDQFLLHRLDIDSGGEPVEITHGAFPSVDPSGAAIVYMILNEETRLDLMKMDLSEGAQPEPFLVTPANESEPRISPDGRYVAYMSDETGVDAVYLTRYPEASGKWQVTDSVGRQIQWSEDGRRLYFTREGTLNVVSIDTSGDAPVIGESDVVFDTFSTGLEMFEGFEAVGDDDRLLTVARQSRTLDTDSRPGMIVIENWFAEFDK